MSVENCMAFLRNAFPGWRLTQTPYNFGTPEPLDSVNVLAYECACGNQWK